MNVSHISTMNEKPIDIHWREVGQDGSELPLIMHVLFITMPFSMKQTLREAAIILRLITRVYKCFLVVKQF